MQDLPWRALDGNASGKLRAETRILRPSQRRNPNSRAPMRPPIYPRWTGSAACAASSVASRPSGLMIGTTRFSPVQGQQSRFEIHYRVGFERGQSDFCSCFDYAISELHLQAMNSDWTAGEEARRQAVFSAAFSASLFVLNRRNDGKGGVYFRAGTDCRRLARGRAGLFDAEHKACFPEERFGDLEAFMPWRRSPVTSSAPITMRSISSRTAELDRPASKLGDCRAPRFDPKALRSEGPIYPYQAEGALFAVRAGRALIGRLGQGKTIQAIAATKYWHGISASRKCW